MRIKNATKATPPTTPPAMAPGLTFLEVDAVVFSGSASAVDDDVALDDDTVELGEDGGELVDDTVDLAVDLALGREEDKNGAATSGFESRKPAVRSAAAHPLVQGLDLQQPMKGGSV